MQNRHRFYSEPEIGIEGGSLEYDLNDTLSFVLKGDSKVGPSLFLKVDGQKIQGIFIEREDAYKIMSMADEKPVKLPELIEWMKNKNEISWNKIAKNIESGTIENRYNKNIRTDDAVEVGIDGASIEYDLNETLSFILKGDDKVGPSLFLKIAGRKVQGIFIEKEDAYKIMSMAEEKQIKLPELIEWMKDKNDKPWNELANHIETTLKTSLKHN